MIEGDWSSDVCSSDLVLDSRPKQRPSLLGLSARSAFHATLGQDAPCGLGVSDPSPQAPPR